MGNGKVLDNRRAEQLVKIIQSTPRGSADYNDAFMEILESVTDFMNNAIRSDTRIQPVEYEDAIQEVSIKLFTVIERFDLSRETSFRSFIFQCIRNEVRHFAKFSIQYKLSGSGDAIDNLRYAKKQLAKQAVENPTIETKLKKYSDKYNLLNSRNNFIALDDIVNNKNNDSKTDKYNLADSGVNIERDYIEKEERVELYKSINMLKDFHKDLIKYYYVYELTMEQIATIFDCSRAYIGAEIKRVMERLTKEMGGNPNLKRLSQYNGKDSNYVKLGIEEFVQAEREKRLKQKMQKALNKNDVGASKKNKLKAADKQSGLKSIDEQVEKLN